MDSWGNEKSPSLSGEGLCTSANRCFHDLPRLARRLAFGQRVDMVHAVDHFAPDGILIVEEARIFEADEELAFRSEERGVGKSVSVRVALGGRRIIKKKNPRKYKK